MHKKTKEGYDIAAEHMPHGIDGQPAGWYYLLTNEEGDDMSSWEGPYDDQATCEWAAMFPIQDKIKDRTGEHAAIKRFLSFLWDQGYTPKNAFDKPLEDDELIAGFFNIDMAAYQEEQVRMLQHMRDTAGAPLPPHRELTVVRPADASLDKLN